jgi:hypothetical protein
MDHIITADDSEEIEIHSKWLDCTWTLEQLFQQPESEMVTAAINKLRSKISGKFDAKILLHELKAMTKEAKENPVNHWTFITPGAMISKAIVCLFILFCCWRMCCSSGPVPTQYPAPSAPPAQPTIFNMTVDLIRRP